MSCQKGIRTASSLTSALAYCVLLTNSQLVYSRSAEDKYISLVREAYLASRDGLRSGIGSGIYESYVQRGKADKDLLPQIRAKVKLYFEDKKYHVRLDYQRNETVAKSRIIICEGKNILTSEFGDQKKIAPTGASVMIFKDLSHDRRAAQAHFFFNPRDLVDEVLELESVLTVPTLSVTQARDGKLLGAYRIGDIQCCFEASSKYGYNVASWKVFYEGSNSLAQDHRAVWERVDNVWIVKSITKDLNALDGTRIRHVLTYDSFEVNPKMPDGIFSFNALNIPQGTRILDQTPDADVREYYYNRPLPSTGQSQLDDLLAQVRSLHHQAIPTPPRLRRYSLLLTGAMLCFLGLLLIWRRHVRKGNITPNP